MGFLYFGEHAVRRDRRGALFVDERAFHHVVARLAHARDTVKPRASSMALMSASICGLPQIMARSVSG